MGIGNTQVVINPFNDYQVVAGDCAAFITNRNAGGNKTYTLPAASELPAGWWVEFYTVFAGTMVITSTPSDRLTVHNDATADTITIGTTIGQHVKVIYDGVNFCVISNPSAASAATAVTAVTIAT
jgi:hypothetical protein